MAGVALRDTQGCSVSTVVLCGRRNTFASVPEEFSWQARHFRSVVFFANRIVRAASSGVKCQFRGRRDILSDVMKIDGRLAQNIDFEVANFQAVQVLRKTRRKTSILKLQSVKIGGSLARHARYFVTFRPV